MNLQRHRLFGLTVETSVSLPDLPSVEDHQPAEVSIEYGQVPSPDGVEPVGIYITDRGAVLNVPEAGRYLIVDGRRIVVEPSPSASERNVRLYLLGSAFGVILHQRQLLPLHANVIDFDGAAVAFMGHSGAGKSTLANWFHDRGLAILGDDVCVVRNTSSATPIVEPGIPRIRLWGDALRASGRLASDYEASFDDMDKYDVPIAAASVADALPLAAIYTLHAATVDEAGSIVRLTGIDAVEALVANTYRGSYVPLMHGVQRHLAQCLSLARHVPVFALHRRWGLEVFDQEAAAVEAHVKSMLAMSPAYRSARLTAAAGRG